MASRIFDTLRRAAGLSLLDWRYLAIAVRELLIARTRHATQPTGKILLQLQEARRPPKKVANGTVDVARLSWAIAVAAARVPWRSDCLLKAMAADRWLRRHHLQPQFYLGVQRSGAGLAAHALLRFGDVTVTGDTVEAFTMLIAPPAEETGSAMAPR
jgi:Transglutaminase-like superfamily